MTRSNDDGFYEVYWPRATSVGETRPLAAKLDTLNGKRVLQLWDFVFHGDKVFALLEEFLKARFPKVEFVSWREIGNILGSDEREVVASLPKRLRALKIDAVITGMAC